MGQDLDAQGAGWLLVAESRYELTAVAGNQIGVGDDEAPRRLWEITHGRTLLFKPAVCSPERATAEAYFLSGRAA